MDKHPRCALCGLHADLFGEKSGFALYACGDCGFTFVFPTPTSVGVYQEDYFSGATAGYGYVNYDSDKEPMVPVFEDYLRQVATFTQGRNLLDVGAATGFFLGIAKRFGYAVQGVDLSPYAAKCASEKGISVRTGTLSDVPAEETFDIITMFDVIEHVPDPIGELEQARTRLATGGVLVINTPDIGSWYARLMGMRWHLIVPPEHLSYFSRRTMQSLLEKKGFTVLKITSVGKRFTLQYICKTLHAWQRLSVWKYLADTCGRSRFGRLALPLNLGDNMFVVARKL